MPVRSCIMQCTVLRVGVYGCGDQVDCGVFGLRREVREEFLQLLGLVYTRKVQDVVDCVFFQRHGHDGSGKDGSLATEYG